MTLQETRQLGIEFERRVQTMIPQKEILEKLDSETIYSFLNQYQDKYVHDIYRSLDMIPAGSKISAHVESVLQALLREDDITMEDPGVIDNTDSENTAIVDTNQVVIAQAGRSVVYPLPKKFYLYIRSLSKVTSTFSFRSGSTGNNTSIRVVPNQLVSQNDVWKLIETPHDSLRILRYPAAVLSTYDNGTPTMTVIYDQYTTPKGIKVLYYAEPQHFDVLTSVECELPMDCFDDLVTGAVDLYVQYVAGAEANRRRQQEAAQQQQQQQRRNNDEE